MIGNAQNTWSGATQNCLKPKEDNTGKARFASPEEKIEIEMHELKMRYIRDIAALRREMDAETDLRKYETSRANRSISEAMEDRRRLREDIELARDRASFFRSLSVVLSGLVIAMAAVAVAVGAS